MTQQQITDAIDQQYRSRASWGEFLDYPCHIECQEPIDAAIKLASRCGGNSIAQGAMAAEIVGLMLDAFEAGQHMTREAVEDVL